MINPNEIEIHIDPEGYKECEMCHETTPAGQLQNSAIGPICYECLSKNQHLAGEYY